MNWNTPFRRFSYPVFGLGLAMCALSAMRRPPSGAESEEGYRRLWVDDSAAASTHLLRALQADPGSPERWIDYAEAMLASGRPDQAGYAIGQAVVSAPELVNIRLRAMNLCFRLGDTEGALRHSAVVIRNSREHWEAVFQAWSRLGGGADRVFRVAAPLPETTRAYFVWLTRNGRLAEATQVWDRLAETHAASRAELAAWVNFLIDRQLLDRAAAVASSHRANEGSYLLNGGFEEALLPDTPDWRVDSAAAFSAELMPHEGVANSAGLHLRFSGANSESRYVRQRLALNPGLYRLSGSLRSQGVAASRGVALALTDVDQPARNAVTESVSGDTNWTGVNTSMEVGPGARLIEVAVIRRATPALEPSTDGEVWVDNVRLVRLGDR